MTTLKDLPSQYDHAAAQERWLPVWEERGYFHADPSSDKPPFSIVIPPPNVTGALHLGHALNNTLQDILCRLKRMQGFEVLWMPGTDHAGIATQAVVERRLLQEEKLSRHDLGREGLVDRIWKWKEQYEARILGQLKQLGCSCDWQRTRFTLDEVCARAVRETFFKLFADGKIYRGKRLVNWDTYLQTAVSDDEVFHEEVKGSFWHFRYPFVEADLKPGEPRHVTIATTRPETMLGDTAVAVHPDPERAFDKLGTDLREKMLVASGKDRAQLNEQAALLLERRAQVLPQLLQLRDMAMRGVRIELPLTGRIIPLVADEWAKPELGSGCVKITPAHDANDYEVWQRHPEIGAINILNPDGTLNNEVAEAYRGLTMAKAREQVVADLAELGCHDPETDREDRLIDLAHSDRSKTPIEPFLADQWFIRMGDHYEYFLEGYRIIAGHVGVPDDRETERQNLNAAIAPGLAQSAINAVESGKVNIVPARYAKTYVDWLREKRDWPVGRQLWWGHRIPVWKKRFATRAEFEAACEDAIRLLTFDDDDSEPADIRESMLDVWDDATGTGQIFYCLRDDQTDVLPAIEAVGFKQDEEVLDTWFSSALWPHSTLGWPEETPELAKFYPTSTLITSRDIITLWVARMVLMGEYNMGEVPFHEVYIHPKILDGFGETMSKSKGNGIDPLDVIQKFGADALRFGIAYLTTETQDVRMPVDFECPHCGATIPQTKKNRVLPRVACDKCKQEFSTQWAEKLEDKALPRGAVVSERFELGRNFCNKLWNAARFTLMNLENFTPGAVATDALLLEDRWLLSRLATVTTQVTEALETYRYADAARTLYDFAWDEFCSFYVEMTKARFANVDQRVVAQRVIAHALDSLLRLLHPMVPFVTEEVWSLLGEVASTRDLHDPDTAAAPNVCVAPWPTAHLADQNTEIEAQFAEFQACLRAVREIRSRQNIAMANELSFSVSCPPEVARRLEGMTPYFQQMVRGVPGEMGPSVVPPRLAASVPLGGTLSGIEVHVDIAAHIDIEAERNRLTAEENKLAKYTASIRGKLANEKFVAGAPSQVVEAERQKLADAEKQLEAVRTSLLKIGAP